MRYAVLGGLCFLAVSATAQDYDIGASFSDGLNAGGNGPQMVVVPSGRFTLGGGRSRDDDIGTVDIPFRFAISEKEISVADFTLFLKSIRSPRLADYNGVNGELPVAGIGFDEAESYVTWLSRETGHHYRLPSASEWEYAARAGTSTIYFWGNELGSGNANCLDCDVPYNGELSPVGSFKPNAWGLYDMHGNVWEWTKDCIDANTAPPRNGAPKLFGNCELRELRGGSAASDGWSIRGGVRASIPRQERDDDIGFRVVMDVPR